MSLIWILLVVAFLTWRAARAAWRLWSALPSRNADFGLVDADIGGRP